MNAGLDKNESELRVLVVAIALKMLTDSDGLLNKVVQILRKRRGKACRGIASSKMSE